VPARPARIIDCGDAGQIELFSAAQVEAARKLWGFTDYVNIMERVEKAPEIAERIIERCEAREEMMERKKEEAQAAITTKMSDLPPLPQDVKH
jgi:hypothetical protein